MLFRQLRQRYLTFERKRIVGLKVLNAGRKENKVLIVLEKVLTTKSRTPKVKIRK